MRFDVPGAQRLPSKRLFDVARGLIGVAAKGPRAPGRCLAPGFHMPVVRAFSLAGASGRPLGGLSALLAAAEVHEQRGRSFALYRPAHAPGLRRRSEKWRLNAF